MSQAEVMTAAQKYIESGLSVIPIRPDGSKAPALNKWKPFQFRQPIIQEVETWFGNDSDNGIAIITGWVSGNLEVIDFDAPELFKPWCELVKILCPGLLERLVSIETPTGGYHTYFRSSFVEGNLKLAKRIVEASEGVTGARKINGRWGATKTLIETRGKGGYVLAPPSPAACHPDGRPYKLLTGELTIIPTITFEERSIMLSAARSFNEYVEAKQTHSPYQDYQRTDDQNLRPGDDYNARGDWESLLTEFGWKRIGIRNRTSLWQRPNKTGLGISATTNFADSNLLYVFSSNALPFEPERAYTLFAAYSLLKHQGDFRVAAKDLAEQGYGTLNKSANLHSTEGQESGQTHFGLPDIDASNFDLAHITEIAWDALSSANHPPFLFRHGGMAIRIETDDQGAPVPKKLTEDRLRHVLARSAKWYRVDSEGRRKAALPPMHVVRDILATPNLRLPALTTITGVPTFAADGTLHIKPGYQPTDRTYYAPQAQLMAIDLIPDRPTRADLEQAKDLILDQLLGDFPFTNEAERAHAVALILLPFIRGLIDGPTPLHLIEKPSPGTGASLLIDIVSYVTTGRPVTAMTEGRDEDEWRKRLTARLRNSPAIVLIDNLRRRLDSTAFAAAITSTIWEDRLLGASETVRLPVRCVWVATGNNPGLSGEIARRTVRIRLDARQDRPWLRYNFRHPNLREWVAKHHGHLVRAVLILGQAWLSEGQPVDKSLPVLGMFEAWTSVVGGILTVAGIPGFLRNLNDFYETTDPEGTTIRWFVSAWWEQFKDKAVGVADLWRLSNLPEGNLDLGDKGERSQKIRLGVMLAQMRDRHYQIGAELIVRITSAGQAQRAQLWKLAPCRISACRE